MTEEFMPSDIYYETFHTVDCTCGDCEFYRERSKFIAQTKEKSNV